MNIVKLEENLIQYTVPSESEEKLGQNFYVLLNGSEALLIDAGYKPQCEQVLKDLEAKGVKVTAAVPSHYHPDHVEGIFLIDSPDVYGNSFAVATLKVFYTDSEVGVMAPTKLLKSGSVLEFGDHRLRFTTAPGHSDCTMLIDINNRFLHIADLYIRNDAGKDVLPYVKWNGVKKHIESLRSVLKYKDYTFLISHGLSPLSYPQLAEGINNRILYLQELLDSDNTATADEAVAKCSKPFLFMKWRAFVK